MRKYNRIASEVDSPFVLRGKDRYRPAGLLAYRGLEPIKRLSKPWNNVSANWHRGAAPRKVITQRLVSPAETGLQESLGDSIKGEIVLRSGKAVSFVRKQGVRHRQSL